MYRNNKYRFEIDIELDNGVYFFNSMSATGKTNLYKKLKKLSSYGERVLAYTFDDIEDKEDKDIIKDIMKKKPCVIMFDRYDLYLGKYDRLIEKIKDRVIVLVDCKTGLNIDDSDMCSIRFSPRKIEVKE